MATAQDSDDESTDIELECGHSPDRRTTSEPGLGRICLRCHTPLPLRQWDDVLREHTTHHPTGESSTYQTWLVGLDEYGRALYHDESNGRVYVLVPKHMRCYSQDQTGDEGLFRARNRRVGRGSILNAPNGDVLVSIDYFDVGGNEFSKRDVAYWIAENALTDGWDALSDRALDKVEFYYDKYRNGNYRDDVFPMRDGRAIIELHSDSGYLR